MTTTPATPGGRPWLVNNHVQRGQGALEFSLAAVPILLMALGGIEAVHWFAVRQAVSQALMQAARAGITEHARPEAIAKAFDKSLLLLFPPSGPASASVMQERQYAIHRRLLGASWHMQILSPAASHFRLYSNPSLAISRQTGLPAIRNSYQLEQHQSRTTKPASGSPRQNASTAEPSIFQANTLELRVVYPHSPLLPGMRGLFQWLGNERGDVRQRTFAAGFLPVVQELSLPMHSDPVQWPLPAGSGFYPAAVNGDDTFGLKTTKPGIACSGLWCGKNQGPPEAKPGAVSGLPVTNTPWMPAGTSSPNEPTDTPKAGSPLEVPQNAPECGVTVCCLAA
jgi:hypothetical protein